jgi:hypothetical protein
MRALGGFSHSPFQQSDQFWVCFNCQFLPRASKLRLFPSRDQEALASVHHHSPSRPSGLGYGFSFRTRKQDTWQTRETGPRQPAERLTLMTAFWLGAHVCLVWAVFVLEDIGHERSWSYMLEPARRYASDKPPKSASDEPSTYAIDMSPTNTSNKPAIYASDEPPKFVFSKLPTYASDTPPINASDKPPIYAPDKPPLYPSDKPWTYVSDAETKGVLTIVKIQVRCASIQSLPFFSFPY